jgi:hypothetical protein
VLRWFGRLSAVCFFFSFLIPLKGLQGQSSADFFAAGLRGAYITDLANFPDIPQYTYTLQILPDYDQTLLTGTGSIRYTNTTPDSLNEIVLRLYPNLITFGGDAVVENMRVNGEPFNPSLDETRSILGLPLTTPLPPGEQVTLDFDYGVTVAHASENMYNQFSYLETELALASVLPLLSVYEPGVGWWRETIHAQGDAVYSETGNFDVTITAPNYLRLITSGTEVGRTNNTDTYTVHYAAPLMRDFSIMGGPRYETLTAQFEDIQLKVHYLPGDEVGAQKVLDWTVAAMGAYTQAFGDYVYNELDVVQTFTSAGGIEYPGMVVVADDIWNPASQHWFEWVTVHEVGHQWWYSMVGNDQINFPWVDEALTDYSVAIYENYVRGAAGYQEYINIFIEMYTEYEAESGASTIGSPAPAYSNAAYSPIVYRKGAVFFDTLAAQMGQDRFLEALRLYLATYRYRVVTPFDLQNALEQSYGAQLDALFLQWVGYSN